MLMHTLANVTLLASTPNATNLVLAAASTCYSTKSPYESMCKVWDIEAENKLLNDLVISGHMSVFEHASFTFGIEDVSRECSHQLVRHRIASFSQQSLRYTKAQESAFRIPASVHENSGFNAVWQNTIETLYKTYSELISSGVPKEDARGLLPMCTTSNLVMTMNARELLHFFELRTCNRAQEEIRKIAVRMLWLLLQENKQLFKYGGPYCMLHGGTCNEVKSCGKRYKGQEEMFRDYGLEI